MQEILESPRFRFIVGLVVVWAVLLAVFELKVMHRPQLGPDTIVGTGDTPVPDFYLRSVSFACASQSGLVSMVRVDAAGRATAKCETSLTEPTTRCPSGLPLVGYGDSIKCSEGEAIHCHDGPLQTVGLFKDDSFCGDITDRDLGPPQEAARSDD